MNSVSFKININIDINKFIERLKQEYKKKGIQDYKIEVFYGRNLDIYTIDSKELFKTTLNIDKNFYEIQIVL